MVLLGYYCSTRRLGNNLNESEYIHIFANVFGLIYRVIRISPTRSIVFVDSSKDEFVILN
jgi:hypothetical protein